MALFWGWVQDAYDRLEHLQEVAKTKIDAMSAHPTNKSRIYVTSAEILQLPSVGNDTVFAVTAPQGTTLSVPNPQEVPEGFRYKCAPVMHHPSCSCPAQCRACLPLPKLVKHKKHQGKLEYDGRQKWVE